jgi:hypothetical protein
MDSNLWPLGQCFDLKLQKGNSWRYPGISGPTYCLTSSSPVVRALVYQPSGPGFDSWHVSFRISYYKETNPNDAFTYLIFVNYILCTNLLAGFSARDYYKGIRTCDLWVSYLIWSYRRAIVGLWRYHVISGPTYCLTSCSPVGRALVYQPRGPGFNSWHVSFRVSYYKGTNPNDAAATYLTSYVLTCL